MTHVSIINESIKDIDFLKTKLEERDASVQILEKIDDLSSCHNSILICHKETLEKNDIDSKGLLTIARNFKIKKIILIESYSENFQLRKELGNSLIKISLINNDVH